MSFSQKYEHFTEAVPDIQSLKRSIDWYLWHQGVKDGIEDQIRELILLLVWCIKQTEAEDRDTKGGVAPYYYHELANVYKRMHLLRFEVRTLERYMSRRHGPGSMKPKIQERLQELKSFLK